MKIKSRHNIRLAFADPSEITRSALCLYLTGYEVFKIVAESGDGESLLRQLAAAEELPDICIIEIAAWKNSYLAITDMRLRWPQMKLLVLSAIQEDYAVVTVFKNGANGFLQKTCMREEVVKALLAINESGSYHTPFTSSLMHRALRSGLAEVTLGEKDFEFLQLICQDLSYKQIGVRMNLSHRTINGYREKLCNLLDIHGRIGLVQFAISNGIYSMPHHR